MGSGIRGAANLGRPHTGGAGATSRQQGALPPPQASRAGQGLRVREAGRPWAGRFLPEQTEPPAAWGLPPPGAGPTECPQLRLQSGHQPPSVWGNRTQKRKWPQILLSAKGCKLPAGKGEPRRRSTDDPAPGVLPQGTLASRGKSAPVLYVRPWAVQSGSVTDARAQQERGRSQSDPSAPRWLPEPLLPAQPVAFSGKPQVSDPLCSALPREPTPRVQGLGGSLNSSSSGP